MLEIYDDALDDPVNTEWAGQLILDAEAGDVDTISRLERLFERHEAWDKLCELLSYGARFLEPASRAEVYRKVARIRARDVSAPDAELAAWEALLSFEDGEAIKALEALHRRNEHPEGIAYLLIHQLEHSESQDEKVTHWRRLAHLQGEELGDYAAAEHSWASLLGLVPTDPEALDAVGGLYRKHGKFDELLGVLEVQTDLANDKEIKISLLLEQADLLANELGQPAQANERLEHILSDLDGQNILAYERLRRLAVAASDWERVIELDERHLRWIEDLDARQSATTIALLWRDQIGNPTEAVRCFERVLQNKPRYQSEKRAGS